MRKFLLFPLFFLVMGLILCCTSRQDSFNDNLNEGLKFMEEGNWNEAVKTFDLCVKEKPAFSVGYFFRSDAYYMKGAYEEALADIIMAAEFWNDTIGVPEYTLYLYRGEIYEHLDMHNEAIAYFDTAYNVALRSEGIDVIKDILYERANLYYYMSDYDSSDTDYKQLLGYDINDSEALLGILRNMLGRNDFQGTIDLSNKCLQNGYNFPLIHFYQMQAYERLGDVENAINNLLIFIDEYEGDDLKDILREHNNSLPFLEVAYNFNLNELKHLLGIKISELNLDYGAAIEEYNKFEVLYGFTPIMYYHRGRCYYASGDSVKANADFEHFANRQYSLERPR